MTTTTRLTAICSSRTTTKPRSCHGEHPDLRMFGLATLVAEA